MFYTHHYQIRWHDTDANREVRPSRLLMYMQETANNQLQSSGMPLDVLRDEHGLAFILSRISVDIKKPLYAYDEIDVDTWVSDGKGFSFNRYFRVRREGEIVAEASTVWALVSLSDHRLLRTDEFSVAAPVDEPLQTSLPRRVRFPRMEEMQAIGERTVRYSDIDYNGHMNNTNYPDMLCDFLPDVLDKRVTGYALSYLHEGTFGHTLRILYAEGEGGELLRTVDADGTVCLEAFVRTERRAGEKTEQTEMSEK